MPIYRLVNKRDCQEPVPAARAGGFPTLEVPMFPYRALLIGATAVALVGCNPFTRSQAVEVSAADLNLNTRWHGTLASPASLAGVVQMSGAYRNVVVDRDGRASTTPDVALHTPTSGRDSVRVTASAANRDLVVACANLAPPSR
jgi:hypothetical protein